MNWNQILSSYTENPRDVRTRDEGIWFYAYGEGENIYIESGRYHQDCSHINGRRLLDRENLEEVYAMYRNGTARYKVCEVTQNSSYWFGIFRELEQR